MSLFLWIVVGAALGALVLGLILKVRLRKQEVWEGLVDHSLSSHSHQTELARDPDEAERFDMDLDSDSKEVEQTQDFQGEEEMNTPPQPESHRSIQDAEHRRSTRVERSISLVVLGTNRRGEVFQERTSAVSLNLHGCRYSSRHEYAPEGWVTLQVTGTDGGNSRPVRARVRSVFSIETTRGQCQVGVELESPGNVWGIPTPPEDWQRVLGSSSSAARAYVTPGVGNGNTSMFSSQADKQPAIGERRAEVTVFPGSPTNGAAPAENVPEKELSPSKVDRAATATENVLQALQGKLQFAAEKAVQASLSSQLDDAVRAALGRIEDGWKATARHAEEFSKARLTEAQNIWEKELHSYRDRAEEVARRIEALTALAQQALSDSQKFAEHFATETAPQLQTRLSDSFARASAEFEARVALISAHHLDQLNEHAQRTVDEVRDAIPQHSSMGSSNPPVSDAVSQPQLESRLDSLRTETLERLEKRLGELYGGFEQQLEAARNRTNDLTRQLEGFALESRQARAQHEHGLAEVRSLWSNNSPGVPEQQIQSLVNSSREQLMSHLEWRLGEVSGHFDQLIGQTHDRASLVSQQLEKLSAETRDQLAEVRGLAERTPRGLAAQDLATIEQSVEHARKEFENAAARASDRQLVRMMEQKHVVTREASLELEARASETRALLQKTSNGVVEEFRRRVESQIDQLLAETSERASSSLASLDAESRAAVEARRRSLETEVARAGEQSAMEFRSGIKAFLYSCLVAAVSAVDQHAQTTLAGLPTDPGGPQRALDSLTNQATTPGSTDFPPKTAGSSQ
jgi:hypothetical protein